MTLVKWNNTHNLHRFGNFFDDLYTRDVAKGFSNRVPAVNIKESKEGYEVALSASGFEKEDFKIVVENNTLIISSDKQVENNTVEEKYTLKEFSYTNFSRSFVLPSTVDAEGIQAKYENGILKVHIPKKAEAKEKAARTIDIA